MNNSTNSSGNNGDLLNFLDLSPFNSTNTSNSVLSNNFSGNTPPNYNIFNSNPNLSSYQESFCNSQNTDFNNNNNYITSSLSLDTLVLNQNHHSIQNRNDNSLAEETNTLLAHSLTSNTSNQGYELDKSAKTPVNNIEEHFQNYDDLELNKNDKFDEKKSLSFIFSDKYDFLNNNLNINNNNSNSNRLLNQQNSSTFMNQTLSISLNDNLSSYLDNSSLHHHPCQQTPSNFLSTSLNTPNHLYHSNYNCKSQQQQQQQQNQHRSSLPISFRSNLNNQSLQPTQQICQSNLLITLLTSENNNNPIQSVSNENSNANDQNNQILNDLDENNIIMQMSPSPLNQMNENANEDTTFQLEELNLPAELVEETISPVNIMDSTNSKIEQIPSISFEDSSPIIIDANPSKELTSSLNEQNNSNINFVNKKHDTILKLPHATNNNKTNTRYNNHQMNAFFESSTSNQFNCSPNINNICNPNNNNNNSINSGYYSNQINHMTAPNSTVTISRSNSQPDLTINIEKLLPFPINFVSNNGATNVYSSSYNQQYSNEMNYSNINNTNNNNNNQIISQRHNQQIHPIQNHYNQQVQMRRHPSLSYHKTSISECNEENDDFFSNFNIIDYLNSNSSSSSNNSNFNMYDSNNQNSNGNSLNLNDANHSSLTLNNNNNSLQLSSSSGVSSYQNNSLDDGLFLGIDAITDFLSKNGSDLFEDLPEIEDLMSLVTFETSSSASVSSAQSSIYNNNNNNCSQLNNHVNVVQPIASQHHQNSQQPQNHQFNHVKQQTHCDLDLNVSLINRNPLSNYYDYTDMNSLILDKNDANNENINSNEISGEQRITRSAPPSPTPQRKKQRPTASLPWHKTWYN